MDWSKAKTILIVAFLITNILLVFVLFSSGKQVERTTTDEFVVDVINLLNDKDIHVDTEIPREMPSLNALTVEYEMYNPNEINFTFFNGEGIVEKNQLDIVEISFGDEIINISNKKRLIYKNNNEQGKHLDLNEEIVKSIALKFLKEKNFDTESTELTYLDENNNTYYLEFSNIINGHYLENSNIVMEIDNRGVKSFERIWLNTQGEGEVPIYIYTAPKAILSLLSMKEVHGKTIKDISLCYYFEPEIHDYVQDPMDAKKGKTVPAWRVLFDDGYKVIIDNL